MSSFTGDELCDACARVDLYGLFTGPRHPSGRPDSLRANDEVAYIAALRGVISNTACSLCGLIKHDLYAYDGSDSSYYHGECDPAKVQCYLPAFRADFDEDTCYHSHDTAEMMATKLDVCLVGSDACSDQDLSYIDQYSRGSGLRLLSPDSVVPERPLLNGFRGTRSERGLDLLKQWIDTCKHYHVDTCQLDPLNALPPSIGLETIQVID